MPGAFFTDCKNSSGRFGIFIFVYFATESVEHKEKKIIVTPLQAQEKLRAWCAYQERSQHEARQKLRSWQIDSEDAEGIIANLIEENFINEERFSRAYARGKFSIKHWGKNKIKMGLRQHQLPELLIITALNQIDENDYLAIIRREIEKKLRLTKSTNKTEQFYKTLQYLVGKGFESDLIKEELNNKIRK